MPAKTEKQANFFRAELGRSRKGEKTKTGLAENILRKFIKKG